MLGENVHVAKIIVVMNALRKDTAYTCYHHYSQSIVIEVTAVTLPTDNVD
jgi:hypothetical protein